MRAPLLILCGVAVVGIAAAIAVPVSTYARMRKAENTAAATLLKIAEAQRTFRARAGHGGYATDLASLTTPCPGDPQAALTIDRNIVREYTFMLRAAQRGVERGVDCHGRATTSDYYAAAQPAHEFAGRHAMAITSRARVFVFFDGIAPRESDMAFGGLAVPLDQLETFKIP